VFKLIPLLNVSVTPMRNLDDFGQALHGDEGLVKKKERMIRLELSWLVRNFVYVPSCFQNAQRKEHG